VDCYPLNAVVHTVQSGLKVTVVAAVVQASPHIDEHLVNNLILNLFLLQKLTRGHQTKIFTLLISQNQLCRITHQTCILCSIYSALLPKNEHLMAGTQILRVSKLVITTIIFLFLIVGVFNIFA
jgi:hypothetical protein